MERVFVLLFGESYDRAENSSKLGGMVHGFNSAKECPISSSSWRPPPFSVMIDCVRLDWRLDILVPHILSSRKLGP